MKFENLGVSVFSLNSNIETFSNLSFSDTRFVILIHIIPFNKFMLFFASRMDQMFLLILWLIGQFRIRVGMKIDGPNYDTPLMQKNMYTIWVVFALSFEGHTYMEKSLQNMSQAPTHAHTTK